MSDLTRDDVREMLEELKKKTEPPNEWFRDGYRVVTVDEVRKENGKRWNDMGVKGIIDRLYAYKDESNDERLNDLIDDVIKLIIDLMSELKGEPI